MSYWPGELVQTLSINGNVLSINPGNSVVLPGSSNTSTFIVVDAQIGSISSLTVSSINGNVDLSGFSINNVSIINGQTANFSTINTNVLNATSTIHAISSISSSVLTVPQITNLSSINGSNISSFGQGGGSNWSLYPAQSTVNMAGNNIGDINNPASLAENIYVNNLIGSAKLDVSGNPLAIANYTTQGAVGNNLAGQRLIAYTSTTGTNLQTTDNVFQNGMNYIKTFEIDNVPYATMSASSTLGGWQFQDKGSNLYLMTNGILTAPVFSTSVLNVSTINGVELTGGGGGGINVSLVNSSTISSGSAAIREITSEAISSLQAALGAVLTSSVTFSFNPNIEIDTGITSLVAAGSAFVGGCLGAFAGVAGGIGSGIYELGTGIAGAVAPRFDKYITNNSFETINQATQLQVSTLGEQISTIYRFTQNVLSTNIFGSTATISVEAFVSTISPLPPFTAIRSLSDPLNLPSSPYEYFQYAGQWVPLPASGISSNVSTISLSTLVLSPSTIMKGDSTNDGLEVLRTDDETLYNVVTAAGYKVALSNTDANFGFYARNSNNAPTWINSNLSSSQFALQGTQVAFTEVDFPVVNGNNSTITNLFINNSSEPSLTYGLYPPGFPSTIAGQIKFLSTAPGGNYGGVQILSQLGDSKSLTVNGGGVFASDIITGSNSDYPLVVQVPDLDQWVLMGLSTMGGGIGKCEIINTATTNTGQLIIAAPNSSNAASIRMLYLDSASTAVGINNPNPQAQLDVGTGLNYASPNSVGIFGGNKDGTLEVTLQNQSAGSNASAFFFAVENTGNEYAGFGINSSNLAPVNNTVTEIPGASIQSGTIDIVIAPQSDHSSNAGIFLGYNDATFAHHINSNGALSFNASYNGTINPGNFGTSNSVLITNGSGAAPSWTNSVNLVNTTTSTLNVGSNITWPQTSFAAPQVFLQGGLSNSPVINTNVIASPYTDTLTFYKGFTNQDFPGGYICLAADNGLMGVNKIPQANIDLDVNGIVCASNISTTQISTNVLNAASAAISSISQPILVDAVPHSTCTLVAAQNWDFFINSWGAYQGKQAVHGGYFINTSNSIGGGQGYGIFMFPPPGLSSFQTVVGTYFTNSSNPGFNTPIWVGNAVAGANGNASTINIYGDLNADVMVSYLGYV